jgi:Pyruvate/2-oxoglutarate dehydrogenase complex, dehydrogenase (E1) component, eukaryotic type, beta subunit
MSWMRRFYAYHRKMSHAYNEDLEHAVLPNAEKLVAAVKQVCYA